MNIWLEEGNVIFVGKGTRAKGQSQGSRWTEFEEWGGQGRAFSRSISSSLIDTHTGRTECGDLRDKLEMRIP